MVASQGRLSGFDNDRLTAGQSVRWLRCHGHGITPDAGGDLKNNDMQLFDLQSDFEEKHNLILEPQKNRETILRMNELMNDLIEKEVGVNDGRFLTPIIGPK